MRARKYDKEGIQLKLICTQPHNAERDRLAAELAGLRADVKALKSERDETAERNGLRDQIAQLKREKATLTEDSERKIRETEHKTGLLKTKQEHDVEHARRLAVLEVREAGLKADKERFEAEMKFQREHFDQRADKQDEILKAILERLPAIDVALNGSAAPRPVSRRGD
jgi:methyltransferase-like protein